MEYCKQCSFNNIVRVLELHVLVNTIFAENGNSNTCSSFLKKIFDCVSWVHIASNGYWGLLTWTVWIIYLLPEKTMKNNSDVASIMFDSIYSISFLQFAYPSSIKLGVLITSNNLRITNLNSVIKLYSSYTECIMYY